MRRTAARERVAPAVPLPSRTGAMPSNERSELRPGAAHPLGGGMSVPATARAAGMRLCAAALLPVLLSCGYRFTAAGAPLPEGIREVQVPVFANHTAEPRLELV